MAQEFYSYDEVLKQLQVEPEELDRMIDDGEVRAFREDSKINFLKSEVENLKRSKMDQPTIAVQSGQSEDQMLIEEIVDDEELESELELSPASVDAEPLLSLSQSEDSGEPLAVFGESGIDSQVEAVKVDTEELVFEEESGEDLLETGELLFESRESLPKDKKIDELFDSDSLDVSPFDSKEERVIEEALNFADEIEEEIVSSAPPITHDSVHTSESQRRTRAKAFGKVAAALIGFAVVAAFMIIDPPKPTEVVDVTVAKVAQNDLSQPYSFEANLAAYSESTLNTPAIGKIVELAEPGKFNKGDALAYILSQTSGASPELQAEVDSLKQQVADETKKYKDAGRTYSSLRKNKEFVTAFKAYQKFRKTKDPEARKAYLAKRDLLAQYFAAVKILKNKKAVVANIRKLRGQLAAKEKELASAKPSEARVAVAAPENGVLSKWLVSENDEITQEQQSLCELSLTSTMVAEFVITKRESKDWKEGESISLSVGGNEVNAQIKEILEKDTEPVSLSLKVEIANDGQFSLDDKAVLSYSKDYKALAVPREAIIEEEDAKYVLVVKGTKAHKRRIQQGTVSGNLVEINDGVSAGETIIVNSTKVAIADIVSDDEGADKEIKILNNEE